MSPVMAGRFFTTTATWETSLALKTLVKSNYLILHIDLEFPFSKEMEILDILIRPHQTVQWKVLVLRWLSRVLYDPYKLCFHHSLCLSFWAVSIFAREPLRCVVGN